jgi:hypothetical protein
VKAYEPEWWWIRYGYESGIPGIDPLLNDIRSLRIRLARETKVRRLTARIHGSMMNDYRILRQQFNGLVNEVFTLRQKHGK